MRKGERCDISFSKRISYNWGVEYTESIYQTLIDNLSRIGVAYTERSLLSENRAEKGKVNCYLGDAALMKGQLDDYNWFFMLNPFSWKLAQNILMNICDSLKKKPRKVYIFYSEPIGHKLIMNTGIFRIKRQVKMDLSFVSYFSYIYESI